MVFVPTVAALALSIAVTCSLFSVVDGLLLRPLPFLKPDRLVAMEYRLVGGRPPNPRSPGFLEKREALRHGVEQSSLIEGAAQSGFKSFFRPDQARDSGLEVTGVDSRFFRLLGLTPAAGIDIGPDDERTPAAQALESEVPLPIVIGHDLSRRLFGSTHAALGVHDLAGRRVRVIGVMGPGVKFPGETNVWAPVPSVRSFLPAYARLRRGATVEQLASTFPDLEVKSLREAVRPGDSRALVVLFLAAVLLLLVTWIQVAALTISGAMGRLHEMGVRLALGASRLRVVRHFAVQNVFVAVAAAGVAWLTVPPLTRFIVEMLPTELQRGQYLAPSLRTLSFSFALSFVGLVLLTMLPVLVARRVTPLGALTGRLAEKPLSADRWRQALLVGQMTLTAVLLYLSGLTLHSFVRVTTFDYGFDADNVLLFTPPAWAPYRGTAQQYDALFDQHTRKVEATIEGLRSLPGVRACGLFSGPLSVGIHWSEAAPVVSFDGQPRMEVLARANAVGIDFAQTLGIGILVGRSFDDAPQAGQHNQVVINETLARQLVPEIDGPGPSLWVTVVGREIRTAAGGGRIVGVIRDLVQKAPGMPAVAEFFELDRGGRASNVIAVRAEPRDETAVRATLERIWGQFSPRQIARMQDHRGRVLAPYRSQSLMLGVIALCCLPIAGIGLIGALSYSVRARTREIAIRIAIGADPRTVRRAIVRRALVTVGVGIILGTAMGAAVGSLIAHQLFEVHPADVSTMVAVAAGLMLLGWLAAVLPARQGARVDPAVALRNA